MAEFNPELGLSATQIPDQSGASRGIPTNRAWETLFSGIGDALTGAAKTVDTTVQQHIRTDVETHQNNLNELMGLGHQAAVDINTASVTPDQQGNVVSPVVSQAATRFGRLTQAYSQGKLSQSMYWDQMATFARELRSRYPGYNQQIDQIIDDVTGRRSPDNRLRSELEQTYSTAASNANASSKALDKEIIDNAQFVPGFDLRKLPNMSTEEKYQVLNGITKVKAEKTGLELDDLRLKNKNMKDQASHADALDVLNRQGSLIATTTMNSAINASGITGKDVAKQIQEALSKPNLKPEEIQSLQVSIQQLRLAAETEFNKLKTSNAGGEASHSEFEEAKKKAMEPFDFLAQLINDNQMGLVVQSANAIKLGTDRDMKIMLDSNVKMRRAIMLNRASPDLAKVYAAESGLYNDILRGVIPGMALDVASGNGTVDSNVESIVTEKKMSPAEQQQATTALVKLFEKTFSMPEATDQNISDMVSKNFTPGQGLSKTFSNVNTEDQYKLFATVTSPRISDRIAKLTDPNLKSMYIKWVVDKFQTIPDVRLAATNIKEANQGNAESNVQFRYNPTTFTFSLVPQVATQFGLEPGVRKNQEEAMQQMIGKFNSDLTNVGYALQKMGLDPKVEIPKILKNLQDQNPTPGKESMIIDMQKSVIAANNPEFRQPVSGTGPLAPGDDELHLNMGESANPFIAGTAKNILNFVAQPESQGDYNAINGYRGSKVELAKFTVSEALALSEELAKGASSGAIGKFQIIPKTMKGLITSMKLTGDEKFTNEMQDKMGMALLVGRGYKQWVSGGMSDVQFADALSEEWAGLPNSRTGLSTHEGVQGNKAGVDFESVITTLRANKADEVSRMQSFDEGDVAASKQYLLQYAQHGAGDIDGLSDTFANRLAAFRQAAPPEYQKYLNVLSGKRSQERQNELFANSDGSGHMVARSGYHVKGEATDFGYRNDKGNWVKFSTARGVPKEVIDWAHANAGNFGLKFPMYWESWHVEPVETRNGKMAGGVDVPKASDIIKLQESRDEVGGGRVDDLLAPPTDAVGTFAIDNVEENLQNFYRNAITPSVSGGDGQNEFRDQGSNDLLGSPEYKASPAELQEGYLPQGMPAKLPMGWVNNNPGNLKFTNSDFQKKYFKGMVGKGVGKDEGTHQIKFVTPEDGLAAMATLALVKNQNGRDTIKKIMFDKGGYTPGHKSALQHISDRMAQKPTDSLDLSDRPQMFAFMRSLLIQELGYPANAYSNDLINKAIDRAYKNREGYDPSKDKTNPYYKKLQKSRISGSQGRNTLPGGTGPFGGGDGDFFGGQTFVEKDHVATEADLSSGTFDASKLPSGEHIPTEDRRLDKTVNRSSTVRALEAMGIDARALIRAILQNDNVNKEAIFNDPNFDFDAYLQDIIDFPSMTNIEQNEKPFYTHEGTTLQKADKEDFEQYRESDISIRQGFRKAELRDTINKIRKERKPKSPRDRL